MSKPLRTLLAMLSVVGCRLVAVRGAVRVEEGPDCEANSRTMLNDLKGRFDTWGVNSQLSEGTIKFNDVLFRRYHLLGIVDSGVLRVVIDQAGVVVEYELWMTSFVIAFTSIFLIGLVASGFSVVFPLTVFWVVFMLYGRWLSLVRIEQFIAEGSFGPRRP